MRPFSRIVSDPQVEYIQTIRQRRNIQIKRSFFLADGKSSAIAKVNIGVVKIFPSVYLLA
jgi:hypothetical protein